MKITKIILLLLVNSMMMAQMPIQIPLNKNWVLECADSNLKNIPAIVPGCVHSDLIRNKNIPDPFYRTNEKNLQWIDKKNWIYTTIFDISRQVLDQSVIELHCLGLDTYCDIYLNHQIVAQTNNMFREYHCNIKPYLKAKGNILKLVFHSPTLTGLKALKEYGIRLPADNDQSTLGDMDSMQVSPFVRKAPYHFGWDWGPRLVTSGIWRPIEIVAYSILKLNDVFFQQTNITAQQAKILTHVSLTSQKSENAQIRIIDKKTKKCIAQQQTFLQQGNNEIKIPFIITKPKLWWTNGLGKQNLYHWQVKIIVQNKVIDSIDQKIGLRSMRIIQKQDEDKKGTSFYVELNGVPVFMKGANHIPNDVFLNRVTPKVYQWEINTAKQSNMNMLRVWGGGIYEDNTFYNLCDQAGILIFQDFMFACSMYPGNTEFLDNVKQEAIDNIKRLRNHACIALWAGNNEIDIAWQQYNAHGGWGWKERFDTSQRKIIWNAYTTIFKNILPQLVNQYDSGAFYMHSSPMVPTPYQHASNETTHEGDMHYWNVWHGSQKPFEEYTRVIGRFMTEYGFQSFPEFVSIKKYSLPQDYNIESEVMKAHQRSGVGNKAIQTYMDMYYKRPKNFQNFLYVGQVLQAEGIQMALESHRRHMPYCMGSLYWQLNDCWPVASWSSTDYYRRWKALQYFAKKVLSPIIVSSILHHGNLETYIVSDKLQPIKNIQITTRVIDFLGNTIDSTQHHSLNIPANTSTLLFTEDCTKYDATNTLVIHTVTKNGKIIAENICYLDKIKNLKLSKPNVQIKVFQKSKRFFAIQVSSNNLAKNVYLQTHKIDGFFSDNFFDVLPKQSKTIYFKSQSDITPKDLLKDIFQNNIAQTYE